eukprot:740151-Pelagomonas_calceolata.AAC.2
MEQPRVMGFHTCALSIQTFKSETPSAIKLMWVCSMRSSRQQQTDPPQLLTSPASHHPSHQLTQLDPPASRRSRGQQYAADGRHWVAVCHTCNKRLLGKAFWFETTGLESADASNKHLVEQGSDTAMALDGAWGGDAGRFPAISFNFGMS